MNKKHNNNGITLIALIVTIVILIILAGITIGAITGDNGIINQANDAKEKTIIAEETEILEVALAYCTKNNASGTRIEAKALEEELNKNQKETTVTPDGEDLEVIFNDSQNKYMVYQDGTIEQIIDGLGNYLIGGKYYNTLPEALEMANEGDVIKVLNDVTENSAIIIDKNITINTNKKKIHFSDYSSNITINEGVSVNINGKGSITSDTGLSLIVNRGQLEINEVTIESSAYGMASATISIRDNGTFIANDSNISAITAWGETASINGGEYGHVMSIDDNIFTVNDGIIEKLDLTKGGIFQINGGKINSIQLSNDANNINLTIGDVNQPVNNNNPEVGRIECVSGDLSTIQTVISFYNGLIKESFFNLETGNDIVGRPFTGKYNIRPGYKAETTSEGTILVEE